MRRTPANGRRPLVHVIVHTSLLALFAARAPAQPPVRTPFPPWTPEQTMRVKPISGVRVSPDGKRVAYAVREAVMEADKSEYRSRIHVVNFDGSDSFPLTSPLHSSEDPQWSPDGDWIAFVSGRRRVNNVWLIRVRGGEAQQLTEAKTAVSSFRWAPDGKSIAFTAADPPTVDEERKARGKDDARVVDDNWKMGRLFVVPVAGDGRDRPKARQLTRGHFNVAPMPGAGGFDWSPDSKVIAFTHTATPRADDWRTADISLVDVASGAIRSLAHTGAAEHAPHYSPDGRWIAYLASDDPPTWGLTSHIRVVPAAGGHARRLAETLDQRPTLVGWSADGKRVYYTETRGTTVRLYALSLSGAPEELGPGEGVLGDVHLNRARTAVGFTLQTADRPPEAHVSRLDRFEPRAVSRANAELRDLPVGRTKVIRWKSADGHEVEELLTYPVSYEKGKRYALLLVIHGGPAGVHTQTFLGTPYPYPVAAFAARGYAVLRCNVRGSTGYGRAFRYANYGDWGGKDFRDLMAGVDHAIRQGVADPERLGVMGWSYGGFMTSWVITHTKRFKAASVGAGVTNLMSFTGTADIPSFVPDYFGGEFWDRPEAYRDHSAMFHVKGVTTPTLIQHGERDERVPISQGYELCNALKRQGCTVQMVVYPRSPHGLREPKLLRDAMRRNLEWFARYVPAGAQEGPRPDSAGRAKLYSY